MTKYLVLLFLSLAACAQGADSPQMVITRNDSFVTGKITGLEELYEDLGFKKGGNPRLFLRDLTADHNDEILLECNGYLCGMGGCLYTLVDGASRRPVGYFLAEALLVRKKKQEDSLPDIQTYSDLGSGHGVLVNYRYSQGLYRRGAQAEIPAERFQRIVDEVGVVKSNRVPEVR